MTVMVHRLTFGMLHKYAPLIPNFGKSQKDVCIERHQNIIQEYIFFFK